MRFIADFHIHSHYSLATSKNLTPEHLDYWAQLKGIDVVGTGDCTHPGWFDELKEKLEPAGNGLYRLKKQYKLNEIEFYLPEKTKRDVYFILTGEISSIYKKNSKVRKVHSVCVFPDFKTVEELQNRLSKIGNITSDGRPILGVDAKDILDITLSVSEKAFIIPAHIWTPWFSVLGDKSGFNNLEECYEDLTKYIFAVETGLSSDPPMNQVCSFLDKFRLVSNSDAHSPEKLGREANIFDTEISYSHIYDALKFDKGFSGTVEFFPQEGKYHYDGHRKCNICWNPVETKKHDGICPVCGKPVTKGVMYRVAELADREYSESLSNGKFFNSITSLPSIAAEIIGASSASKKAAQMYFNILEKIGSDFYTLLYADIEEIRKYGGDLLAEGIKRMRNCEVNLQEGYDGEFGKITMFQNGETSRLGQAGLFSDHGFVKNTQQKNSIKFDIGSFRNISSSAPKPLPQENKENKDNTEQLEAIVHNKGACMVIAGPGSGKTYILTERIIRLIKKEKVPQENILAVTFSNKAAEEIFNRVEAKVSNLNAFISTFHSFGLSILKKHCNHFGRDENFLIAESDSDESKKVLKQISDYKQGINRDESVLPLVEEHDLKLKNKNLFDLDDLIYLPVKLLKEDSNLLARHRIQYKYILIDEFQDINPIQYELIHLLCAGLDPNLFVIGDPDQAIYGFRGSDVRYIDKIKQDYPQIRVIELSKSYRCPAPVLKIGGQVLNKDKYFDGKPVDIKIDITGCETDKSEADIIAGQIEKMIGGVRSFSMHSGISDGTEYKDINSFSDFAILCRTSTMFDPIVNALRNHGIPCQVTGTDSFFKEEPFNSLLQQFRAVCCNPFMESSIKDMIRNGKDVSLILSYLIQEIDIKESEKKRFVNLGAGFGNDYHAFFNNLALHRDIDDLDIKQEAVSVLTLHASKGLEFKAVFIPGCENGIIPFEIFGKKDPEEIEEEKRLFYVGITRTKKYLFLTHAHKRFFKGRILEQMKSGFLENLEKDILNLQTRKSKIQESQLQLSLFE